MADEEKEQGPTLADLLRKLPGAPAQEQVDAWKKLHGDVYVSGLSEDEFYIFRSLRRSEWRGLLARREDPKEQIDQLRQEEIICETCVLWPKLDNEAWVPSKAGTASALSEQIMAQSNFVNAQALALLVQKL